MKEIGFPNMAIPLRRLIPTYPPLDCANEFRKHHRGAQNAPLPKEEKETQWAKKKKRGAASVHFDFLFSLPLIPFFSSWLKRENRMKYAAHVRGEEKKTRLLLPS